MSRYLFVDNNLSDLTDIVLARKNLDLGNLATINSNEVTITGGNISVDNFQLYPGATNINNSNFFLRNKDLNGNTEWFEIPSLEWLDKYQPNILISNFSNDIQFVRNEELSEVAFTGNFNDITNLPQSLSEIYQDDILNRFLIRESNLQDIDDKEEARSNLGLGNISTQNIDDVRISNLTIKDSIYFSNDLESGYLFIDSNSKLITKNNFTIATENVPGIVYRCNVNINNSNSVATSSLIYSLNSNLEKKIDEVYLTDFENIVDLLQDTNFLLKSNLLSEFANDNVSKEVRSNLGFGDICTQNSNNMNVINLTVDSLVFKTNNIENKVLSFDENSKSQFIDLPTATEYDPGIVYLINDYENYTPDDKTSHSVLSYQGFSNYVNFLNNELIETRSEILANIPDLSGNSEYLKRQNNLSDVFDIDAAKSNLQLAKIATTGKYNDLTDRPYDLSSFSNDVGFILGSNNLSDINDVVAARSNLGLGSMALQDINNVKIRGGIAKFRKLQIKGNFNYTNYNNNPDGKILVCDDRNGRMVWRDLPKATYSTYGAVKITDHIKPNDSRTDVVPTCRVFRELSDTLLNVLNTTLTEYIKSDEFLQKIVDEKYFPIGENDF